MYASFFAATQAVAIGEDKTPGKTVQVADPAAKSFLTLAKKCAAKAGVTLSDQGHLEYSARFKKVLSFGVEGFDQRMFVWSGS